MEKYVKHNDYAIMAFVFSLLSLIGSCLSLINAIPLIITAQLLQDAKRQGLNHKYYRLIHSLYETGILLTICFSVLYLSIQL